MSNLFFEDPKNNRTSPADYGVLHLLRKDILLCLGYDPVTQKRTSHRTLWPGGMAILAGIDLVAKFLAGNDNNGQVGKRFRDYVNKYFQQLASGDEETIYQLRNALLHSFGLYSKTKTKTYNFVLTANQYPLIQSKGTNLYQIDLLTLYIKFEDSLEKYQKDLTNNSTLQNNFCNMFGNYGIIHIG